nr:phage portal protein [Candidatus Omnitrophota bacterium]
MVLEEAYLKRELKAETFLKMKEYWTQSSWIAPGWEWVDPLKEVQAAEVGLKNGITTYSDLYASEGKDWEESLEQRKREQAKIKELGLEDVIANDSKPKEKGAVKAPKEDEDN